MFGQERDGLAGTAGASNIRSIASLIMEHRKHWWNGRWGRLTRRDILLFEDGGQWWVEAREGGPDGHSRWFELPDEDRALDCARDLMAGRDGWREMPTG
jgi:hypothetical protein